MKSSGFFDIIVDIQDKTLTGTWNPLQLFILTFLVVCVVSYIYNYIIRSTIIKDELYMFSLKIAIIAIVMNFISGKLFVARKKMYTRKGFSKQKSTAQAYSNARLAQVMGALI